MLAVGVGVLILSGVAYQMWTRRPLSTRLRSVYKGDVNADGERDERDIEQLETLMGRCVEVGAPFPTSADLDGDGCITAGDRALLRAWVSQ
jgi:hypothetical protein